MSLPVVFRPEAEADVLAARGWYTRQRAGLGEAFADSVEETVRRIVTMPELFEAVLPDVRRAKLKRFPYLVYFRMLADRIEILAVLHGGRDPRLWQERV